MKKELYRHEDYSAAIVRTHFRSAIEDHPSCNNYGFTADDVASLIEGTAGAKQGIFWRDIISGQMDADRMDYLLRDSHHVGVSYGKFDFQRLVATIQAIQGADRRPPRLGISEGGWHAAEALVLARYFMSTQVYFHNSILSIRSSILAIRHHRSGGTPRWPAGRHLTKVLVV